MSITLRQKRYREVQDSLARAEAQREDSLAKLIRSETKLKALRKQKIRLKRGLDQMKSLLDQRERIIAKTTSTQEPVPVAVSSNGELEIPDFLKRDRAAAAEIKAEQATKKRTKSLVRIEKMKAKASGETKKMPLTGKAAMEFLRTGKR